MILKHILLFGFFVLFLNVFCAYGDVIPRGNIPRRRIRKPFTNYTASVPGHEAEVLEDEYSDNNAVMLMLHKINDRLTAMSTVNDQQSRRFESLEYRITKLEVQIQEKTEVLRSDLKEVSRRVQQLDWQSSKTESALDALKSDTSFLKQAMEHFRIARVSGTPNAHISPGVSSELGPDISNKLQMVLRTVQTLLNGFSSLQADVSVLRRNVTGISNSSRALDSSLPNLLTTKHFQRALLDLQRHNYHPVCSASVAGTNFVTSFDSLPRDCSEVQGNKSTVYRIKPPSAHAPFFVFCDLETRGGGWTVIQRRSEGTLEFYKGWHDYKHGFGNIGGEFWLGLEKIHSLTNYKVNEIYIELEDFALEKSYAHYSAFAVGSEVEGYSINFLGTYEGNAGDSLLYHAGQKFSTFDMDHDNWAEGNCAQSHNGAWWYNGCDTSNLNGRYLNGEIPDQYEYQGMYWYEFRGPKYSLKESKIMVRPVKDNYSKISEPSGDIEQDYINLLNNQ